jgi:molybdate transport system substrate-binding protein
VRIEARFGAVGALKAALAAGAACDVMVVTEAMAAALQAGGELGATPRVPLGRVRTGVAVRSGAERPDIDTPEALRRSLLAAGAIYFPDPSLATAGIHFAAVLERLGLGDAVAGKLRTFPNGATTMRELAGAAEPAAIGCTQVTEILGTPGVEFVGALPAGFELATLYSAALGARPADAALARRFVAMLAGPDSAARRAEAGFDSP